MKNKVSFLLLQHNHKNHLADVHTTISSISLTGKVFCIIVCAEIIMRSQFGCTNLSAGYIPMKRVIMRPFLMRIKFLYQ